MLGLRCSTSRIFPDRHPPHSAVPLNKHAILFLACQILVLIATSSHCVHQLSPTCWQFNALRLVSMVCWPRVPCVGLLPVTGHLMLCRRSRLVVGDRWLLRVAGHHVLCWRSCLARANGQIMHYSLDVLYVAGSHSLLELVIK